MDQDGGLAIEPNISHALGALVACSGGEWVTTNITDATLLTLPDDDSAKFSAPHGTLCDQRAKGRDLVHCDRRRQRSFGQLRDPLLNGRGVFIEIPVTVDDKDPNVTDTRCAAAQDHLKTLVVIGNSILKSTNGRALNFLSAMESCENVVFVNIDESRTEKCLLSDLDGWGLDCKKPEGSHVRFEHVCQTAVAFSEGVLGMLSHDVRQRCEAWVSPDEVQRKRRMLQLPPRDLGGRENHKFGQSEVSTGTLFDEMKRLNDLAQ